MKSHRLFLALIFFFAAFSCNTLKKNTNQIPASESLIKDYLTVDEAVASLKIPESAAKLAVNTVIS